MKNLFEEYKELVLVVAMSVLFLFIFKGGWGALGLPSADTLVDFVVNLFNQYGLVIVFFAALIESILLVGGYFPGTMIIFLSLSVSGGDLQKTLATVLVATAGMLVGYSIDYFLGKNGVSKILNKLNLNNEVEKLKKEIDRQGLWAGFFLYILPGFGSLISTTFGILKFNFLNFFGFILLTVLIWNSIWGITGYVFGDEVLKLITSGYFGFIILGIFIVYFVASGRYAEFKKALAEN
jgi:membrane protein DedA with SNARE-associated domain